MRYQGSNIMKIHRAQKVSGFVKKEGLGEGYRGKLILELGWEGGGGMPQFWRTVNLF